MWHVKTERLHVPLCFFHVIYSVTVIGVIYRRTPDNSEFWTVLKSLSRVMTREAVGEVSPNNIRKAFSSGVLYHSKEHRPEEYREGQDVGICPVRCARNTRV